MLSCLAFHATLQSTFAARLQISLGVMANRVSTAVTSSGMQPTEDGPKNQGHHPQTAPPTPWAASASSAARAVYMLPRAALAGHPNEDQHAPPSAGCVLPCLSCHATLHSTTLQKNAQHPRSMHCQCRSTRGCSSVGTTRTRLAHHMHSPNTRRGVLGVAPLLMKAEPHRETGASGRCTCRRLG